jgi:hypothetical protein
MSNLFRGLLLFGGRFFSFAFRRTRTAARFSSRSRLSLALGQFTILSLPSAHSFRVSPIGVTRLHPMFVEIGSRKFRDFALIISFAWTGSRSLSTIPTSWTFSFSASRAWLFSSYGALRSRSISSIPTPRAGPSETFFAFLKKEFLKLLLTYSLFCVRHHLTLLFCSSPSLDFKLHINYFSVWIWNGVG